MNFRLQLQMDEAFGPINRWFCSEHHGREIDDAESLLTYYIKNGGAKDFAERYEKAMGALNRWYCSEYYGCEIRDPEMLWDYYMNRAPHRAVGHHSRYELDDSLAELDRRNNFVGDANPLYSF